MLKPLGGSKISKQIIDAQGSLADYGHVFLSMLLVNDDLAKACYSVLRAHKIDTHMRMSVPHA